MKRALILNCFHFLKIALEITHRQPDKIKQQNNTKSIVFRWIGPHWYLSITYEPGVIYWNLDIDEDTYFDYINLRSRVIRCYEELIINCLPDQVLDSEHPSWKELEGMGWPAIPILVDEMRRSEDDASDLVGHITGQKFSGRSKHEKIADIYDWLFYAIYSEGVSLGSIKLGKVYDFQNDIRNKRFKGKAGAVGAKKSRSPA